MSDRIEVVVVGGGVVGLACAAALSRRGHAVALLERRDRVGAETSSRNSEVVHAGLYYPPGSLKARSCVRGRELLVRRCRAWGIGYRRTGKLVVASDPNQVPALQALLRRGRDNGAGALTLLDARSLRAKEPAVRGCAALWSPESGIVDSHALLESYRREAQDHGALVALRTEATGLQRASGGGWLIETRDTRGEGHTLTCRWVINAAGLASDKLAELAGVDVAARRWRLHFNKGDYFALAPRLRGLVRHLVYPLPTGAGLGVHVTMDLSGALRAGPDTEWVDAPRYDVAPHKRATFGQALRRYLPEVRDEDLQPAYAGVRPKLAGPGEPFRDFVCEVADEAPRMLQLIGVESPGLTAAGALAERVVERVQED